MDQLPADQEGKGIETNDNNRLEIKKCPWDEYLEYCIKKKTFFFQDKPKCSDPWIASNTYNYNFIVEDNNEQKEADNSWY